MKTYANPVADRTTNPGVAAAPASPARTLERIAPATAARLGAIAGGLIWLFDALITFVFDLFGINLWLTVIEARWMPSEGWESLPVSLAEFGGLVVGTASAILAGAHRPHTRP
jgi:hypothetical protein